MLQLLLVALGGLAAQLVDGSLGMGYGLTSSSLLLAVGLSPALASASVHVAELGTNIVSGVSHHGLGNVDWKLVARLGIPGAVGAFAGATVLSTLHTAVAAPVMAALLTALGAYVLARYAVRPPAVAEARVSPHRKRFLVPLGLLGGFVDATGGGGWGPISTTSLLSAGRTAPRTVVGSVDTSEFLVSAAASAGFLVSLGAQGINWAFVVALLAGGAIAAPVAARFVAVLPAEVLGLAVGGLIVASNLHRLLGGLEAPAAVVAAGWAATLAVVAPLLVRAVRRRRAARAAASARAALAGAAA